ncbi:MAG: serine/threonine protein phosphatase [Thermoprotei archaeon]|nr:MAG: serine/threonine protein phosphatase [Thermoprotei archaeon]
MLEEKVQELISKLKHSLEEYWEDSQNLKFIKMRDELLSPLGYMLVRAIKPRKIVFVGDLHGDFESLEKIYEKYSEEKDILIVFLGDYVDRGPKQLETLLGVLLWKLENPEKIVMLRGNHETPSMNMYYGFMAALRNNLGELYSIFYRDFVEPLYLKLSIAFLADWDDSRIFAVHGGIPVEPFRIEDIEELEPELDPDDPILMQLLWNDPNDRVEKYRSSFRGPGVYVFGREVFERFVKENKVKLVVRAHEPVYGVSTMFEGRLYTVFTCRFYRIRPAVLEVDENLSPKSVFID